jgi:hypothetical protein
VVRRGWRQACCPLTHSFSQLAGGSLITELQVGGLFGDHDFLCANSSKSGTCLTLGEQKISDGRVAMPEFLAPEVILSEAGISEANCIVLSIRWSVS